MNTFPSIPKWASNKNYLWHSNPESRPICRTLFDKCVIRPKVNIAYEILKGERKGDKDAASKTVDLYNNDAAKMAAGRITQQLLNDYLVDHKADTLDDCVDAGKELFAEYKPRTWDEGKDQNQLEICVGSFFDVFKNALQALEEAQNKLRINKLSGEEDYMFQVPGLQLEYSGKPDFNGQIELKTTWATYSKLMASGRRSASIPTQPQWSHLCQVAGYWARNRKPQALVYVNEKNYRVFTEENCEKLSEESLQNIWNFIVNKCRIRENLLQSSKSIQDLLGLIEPDFSHMWAWDLHPDVLKEAKQQWGFV